MKVKKGQEASLTQPLLQDLIQRSKVDTKLSFDRMKSTVASTPPPQPDLYQDAGGGYNTDFVFPQD